MTINNIDYSVKFNARGHVKTFISCLFILLKT